MTQVFINETDLAQPVPKKIEDFIVTHNEETFVSVPVAGKFLPIKKYLFPQFEDYYKRHKKEVENFCKNFWGQK